MSRLLTIARTEWIHNLRDKRSLFVILALPVLLLLIYGYGINYDLRDIPFAVQDLSGTDASRNLIQSLIRTGYFRMTEVVTQRERIPLLLDRGSVVLVIVIPPDFDRKLGAGQASPVQVLINGADTTRAGVAQGYIQGALADYSSRLVAEYRLRQGVEAPGGMEVRTTILYNPGLSSTHFIVPGLIAILLTILSSLLTSTAVVREREWGSFESLITSPARPSDIMLGKLMPYIGIAFADVILSIVTGVLIFHVVPVGSVLLLLAVSFLYLLASLSLGLVYSTIVKTQQLAILLAMLTTLLPTILLSGFVFPVRSMPLPLQLISNFIPATHFLIVIRGIYLKDSGLDTLWPRVIFLTIIAIGLLLVAARRFRKRL